jgi:hypothetical protein
VLSGAVIITLRAMFTVARLGMTVLTELASSSLNNVSAEQDSRIGLTRSNGTLSPKLHIADQDRL